jgi:hypothetical protein
MNRLAAFLLALFASSSALPAEEVWRFGPFSMPAIAGFAHKEGRSPAVYTNSSGSVALVTVHLLEGTPSLEDAARLVERATSVARSTFERAASRYGKPVAPFAESTLPSGDKLVSLPVETAESTGTGFLLQYGIISPMGNVAIITIEGRGSPAKVEANVRSAIQRARFGT